MPALTIETPRPSDAVSPTGVPPLSLSTSSQDVDGSEQAPSSPIAPAYSPITPKIKPALPATVYAPEDGIDNRVHPDVESQPQPPATKEAEKQAPPPTANYIPRPPPQPFSNEDSTDAIALRAAISALQFQKKKAQDDVRALETVRKQALASPEHFKTELAAGRMNEQRHKIGDLNAIADHSDSSSDSESENESPKNQKPTSPATKETPNSQPTTGSKPSPPKKDSPPFASIPGPQNVVRMPPINWAKYHVSGATLDSLHEQQKRWPGNAATFGSDRGREHSVASPYSPFLDTLDSGAAAYGGEGFDARKDSVAAPMSAFGTVSEHPMETRRTSGKKPMH